MKILTFSPYLILAIGALVACAERNEPTTPADVSQPQQVELPTPTGELTQVSGGLYRYANASHVSVVYIWDEGVVVTDPISTPDATWLKTQIDQLTDKPITHLIYSHSHWDHGSGGQAFGPVPEVIAHANAPESFDGVAVTRRFDDSLSLDLGSSTVELTYLGAGHGEDSIAMVFRPENVAFAVDVVHARRLPYQNFGGVDVDQLMAQIGRVEALDFDVFVGGHGPVGGPQDVADHLQYYVELKTAVEDGLEQGKTVEQLKTEVLMANYSNWINYDIWRELNIEGMAHFLQQSGATE